MNIESLSDLVLVTGVSGGGKSIAMHALEDAGFFCVDNLPPELLTDFLKVEHQRGERRVAIAVDVRSKGSLPHLLPLIKQLRKEGQPPRWCGASPKRAARTRCATSAATRRRAARRPIRVR